MARQIIRDAVISTTKVHIPTRHCRVGEHDGFVLIEAPDNAAAAAFSVGIAAGGRLRSSEVTVLLTVEETLEVLRKAKDLPYRSPGEIK